MKLKRICTILVSMSLLLTSGFGEVAQAVTVLAKSQTGIAFDAVETVEPITGIDGAVVLSQTITQTTATTAQINLTLVAQEQGTDFSDAEVMYQLAPELQITSEKVDVTGLDENDEATGAITADGRELTLRFGTMSASTVSLAFTVKIHADAEEKMGVPVSTQATFVAQASNQARLEADFPVPRFDLRVAAAEADVQPDVLGEDQQGEPNREPEVLPTEGQLVEEPFQSIQEATLLTTLSEQTLNVGDELTVQIEASGVKPAAAPSTMKPAEWLFVFDNSASLEMFWSEPANKQALVDEIRRIRAMEGARVSGVVLNGANPEVFSETDTLETIEAQLLALTSVEKTTDFPALWTSEQLQTFIGTPPVAEMTKNVVIISDWLATTESDQEQNSTVVDSQAQAQALAKYQAQIVAQIEQLEYSDAIHFYPIQVGETLAGTQLLDELRNQATQRQPWQVQATVTHTQTLAKALETIRIRNQMSIEPIELTTQVNQQHFSILPESVTLVGALGQETRTKNGGIETIAFTDVIATSEKVSVTYQLKALQAGTFQIGMHTEIASGEQKRTAEAVSVSVEAVKQAEQLLSTDSMQTSRLNLPKLATPNRIAQGEVTEVVLTVKGNVRENTETDFFIYSSAWKPYLYAKRDKTNAAIINPSDRDETSYDDSYHTTARLDSDGILVDKDERSGKGETIAFEFSGTGFDWYFGNKHLDSKPNHNMAKVDLVITDENGTEVERIIDMTWGESNNYQQASQRIYRKHGLPYGTYKVTLTVKEAGFLYNDRVEIVTPYGGPVPTDTIMEAEKMFTKINGQNASWSEVDGFLVASLLKNDSLTSRPTLQFQFTGTEFELYGKTAKINADENGVTWFDVRIQNSQGKDMIQTTDKDNPQYLYATNKIDETNGFLLGQVHLPYDTYTVTLTLKMGTVYIDKAILKRPDTSTQHLNITDYLNTADFEFVPGQYAIETHNPTQPLESGLEFATVTANDTQIMWNEITIDNHHTTLKYKIRAKNTREKNDYQVLTNPNPRKPKIDDVPLGTPIGTVVVEEPIHTTNYFADAEVTITPPEIKLNPVKTATPVVDEQGNETGEYEIALTLSHYTEQPLRDDWSYETTGYGGTTRIDTSIAKEGEVGLPITLKNQQGSVVTYERGLGTHSKSMILYDLTQAPYVDYDYFESVIGIDTAKQGTKAAVKFQVYTDVAVESDGTVNLDTLHALPYTVHQFKADTASQAIRVPITDCQNLLLVVETMQADGKDSHNHANWADAKLTKVKLPIVDDAILTDVVSKYFSVVPDGYGKGATAVVAQTAKSDFKLIPTKLATTPEGAEQLQWQLAPIDDMSGLTVKFKVKPTDEYYGNRNVPTNERAFVDYTGSNHAAIEHEFPVPTVNLPYTKGSITIQKEIDGTVVDLGDHFAISLVGSEQFTMDLASNETKTMEFYLKGPNTDVSPNDDQSLAYVTAGAYQVQEVVPMNYTQVAVWIETNPLDEQEEWRELTKDELISLDKDKPIVYLKVTNRKTNTKYWQDQKNVANNFDYTNLPPRSGDSVQSLLTGR